MSGQVRLFRISQWVMYSSSLILLFCLTLVFGLEGRINLVWLVIGHAFVMLSAIGVKLGYIMRLEALKKIRRASLS